MNMISLKNQDRIKKTIESHFMEKDTFIWAAQAVQFDRIDYDIVVSWAQNVGIIGNILSITTSWNDDWDGKDHPSAYLIITERSLTSKMVIKHCTLNGNAITDKEMDLVLSMLECFDFDGNESYMKFNLRGK